MIKNRTLSTKISLLFFLASFLVATIYKAVGLIIVFICLLFFISRMVSPKYQIILNEHDIWIIALFYSMPFISLSLCTVTIFICGIPYIEFYPSHIGRMVNMIIYFSSFIFITQQKNKKKINTDDAINYYLYGCYCLMFFGIWQLLNNLFGVPYFDFKTRNQIHSIDTKKLLPFMDARITSIAEEPAYLIPYLIDAGIIAIYSHRNKLITLSILILIFFTLSLSGYINLFIISATMLLFTFTNYKKIAFILILIPCFVYMIYKFEFIFSTVLARLNPDDLLKSDRLQEIILPIKYMFTNAPLFNLIFGFGPKGLVYVCQFLTYTYGFWQGKMLAAETHLLLADFLIEYGLWGFVAGFCLFAYLFKLGSKTYKITKNRMAQILSLNLVITSLYTSDYASPRFTAIILLILFFYKDATSKKSFYEKNPPS
jgi:hypothetical protein